MNMSRSIRRQLIGADLVRGVVEACREAGRIAATREGHRALFKLEREAERAATYAYGRTNADGTWSLDDKATKAYATALVAVKNTVLSRYEEGADAREYVAAVLVWVEDLRAGLPAFPPERRQAWFDVAHHLQGLINMLDPRQEDDAPYDSGQATGEVFKAAARVF